MNVGYSDLRANYTTHDMLTYPALCCQNQSAPVLHRSIVVILFSKIGRQIYEIYGDKRVKAVRCCEKQPVFMDHSTDTCITCPCCLYFLLLRQKKVTKKRRFLAQLLRGPKNSSPLLRHSIYRRYGAEILPILAGIEPCQAC